MFKSVQEINREYGFSDENILVVQKLYDKGFDDSDVVDIFNIFASSCDKCYNGEANCRCWDDD